MTINVFSASLCRWAAVAILAVAAFGVAGTHSSDAHAQETKRIQIYGPSSLTVGVFHDGIARFAEIGRRDENGIERALGGPDGVATFSRAMTEVDQDKRADEFIRSWSAVQTAILQEILYSNIMQQWPELANRLPSPTTRLYLADGRTTDMPLLEARALHLASLILTREIMIRDGEWPDLAGIYQGTVDGDCPFESGPFTVDQKEFALEVSANDRIVMVGAVGSGRVSAILNEARFATLVFAENEPPRLDAPDRPVQLLSGPVSAGATVLTSNVEGGCTVTLDRKATATAPSKREAPPATKGR